MLSLVRATFGKPHYHKYSPFFYFAGPVFRPRFLYAVKEENSAPFRALFSCFWICFLHCRPSCPVQDARTAAANGLPYFFWKFSCLLDRFSNAIPDSSGRFRNFHGRPLKQPSLPFGNPLVSWTGTPASLQGAIQASSGRFRNFHGRPLQTAFLIFLETLLYIGPALLRLCRARSPH